jgi:hypothetical protein
MDHPAPSKLQDQSDEVEAAVVQRGHTVGRRQHFLLLVIINYLDNAFETPALISTFTRNNNNNYFKSLSNSIAIHYFTCTPT